MCVFGQWQEARVPRKNPHRQWRSCKLQTEKPLALGDPCCEVEVLTAVSLRYPCSYLTHLNPDACIVAAMVSFRTQIWNKWGLLKIREVFSVWWIWKNHFLNLGSGLPICAHLCFLLLGQRHPSVRCSSETSHGCTSSKRVQLWWQDSWQLISDLDAQCRTSLSPVSSFAFTSHNVTTALFSIRSQIKCEHVFANCLLRKQFIMLGRLNWDQFSACFSNFRATENTSYKTFL